jgi:uncharacterized membrane protein
MKTLFFLLVVIGIGILAWYFLSGYRRVKPISEKITTTDTVLIVKDSIINANVFDTIPLGFYQGMLPCSNCEGIQRTIMFSEDGHYKMEELSWGKGTSAKKTEGTWENVKGNFLLSVNNKVVSRYRLIKDSLINFENNGSSIADSSFKEYALFKKNTEPESPAWKKRKSEGVDIIGNGDDPFWNVEIDNNKFVLFRLASSGRPVIVPVEKPTITKDSTVYSMTTDANILLRISIASRFCNDGISSHVYEYKMTVWYNGQMYKGCATFLNGVGQD